MLKIRPTGRYFLMRRRASKLLCLRVRFERRSDVPQLRDREAVPRQTFVTDKNLVEGEYSPLFSKIKSSPFKDDELGASSTQSRFIPNPYAHKMCASQRPVTNQDLVNMTELAVLFPQPLVDYAELELRL